MKDEYASSENLYWTWADLVSTYRFWGLMVVMLLCTCAPAILGAMAYVKKDMNVQTMTVLNTAQNIASFVGIALAWVSSRNRRGSYFCMGCVLLLMMGGIMAYHSSTTLGMGFSICGSVLLGLGVGALRYAVPAMLAEACGKAEAFVIAFGLLSVTPWLWGVLANALAMTLLDAGIPGVVQVEVILVVAFVILITLKRDLFLAPRPERGYAFTTIRRDPVGVGLLCNFVPGYVYYWIYRAHGEIAGLRESRQLLSPRAAVWCALFLPLFFLVQMVTLLDVLREHASIGGGRPVHPTWVIATWGIFFPPVCCALIQSDMNHLSATADMPKDAQPATSPYLEPAARSSHR